MTSRRIIVGIDGGGTSTNSVVATTHGEVLVRGAAGPSNEGLGNNRNAKLQEALQGTLRPVLGLVKQGFVLERVCVGMAGLLSNDFTSEVRDVIKQFLSVREIDITDDMEIAFKGASLGHSGILIYGGTGANCYGKDRNGVTARVNGWGFVIDDEGGGYDIGRRAMRAVARSYDGRGKETLLTSLIFENFSCNSMRDLCRAVYSSEGIRKSEIGQLAILVSQAAEAGDGVALGILEHAGRELGLAVMALYKRLDFDLPVMIYPCGGVFNAGAFLFDAFIRTIETEISSYEVCPPRFSPEVGALLIGADQAGISVDDCFISRLQETYSGQSAKEQAVSI